MTIVCKRVDFNNFDSSLIQLHSTVVTDLYNNKMNMVGLQLNNKINMELEIIGDNVYIHKHIKKNSSSDKEILSFIVDKVSTIYTLKIIIKNDMDEKKLIYLGNYTFNILTHKINKECNVTLTIKKKIERDEEHESEHGSEHEEDHDNESKQESEEDDDDDDDELEKQQNIITQGGSVDDDDDDDDDVTRSVDVDDEDEDDDEDDEGHEDFWEPTKNVR